MAKLGYLCTASFERSVSCERITEKKTVERGISIETGCAALVQAPKAPSSGIYYPLRIVLNTRGYDTRPHTPTVVTREFMKSCDKVLCMEPSQRDILIEDYGDLADNIDTLPHYATGSEDRIAAPSELIIKPAWGRTWWYQLQGFIPETNEIEVNAINMRMVRTLEQYIDKALERFIQEQGLTI